MAEDSQEVSHVEEEEEEAGGAERPRDDIRIAVKGFQQDADQFSYDIEVKEELFHSHTHVAVHANVPHA